MAETRDELIVRFEQLGALEQEFDDAELEISMPARCELTRTWLD